MRRYKIKSEVWLYPGMAGWHFVSLSKKQSEEIKKKYGGNHRGWGSLPIEVKLGTSIWKTSIFPDKKSSTYVLPLKASVRKQEGIYKGDIVNFFITITV